MKKEMHSQNSVAAGDGAGQVTLAVESPSISSSHLGCGLFQLRPKVFGPHLGDFNSIPDFPLLCLALTQRSADEAYFGLSC